MESLPESAGPTYANNCPFARTGPLRTKSRCEIPICFTQGWHSGDAGVCLWAVHGATGAADVHSCGILRRQEWRWGCCELHMKPTPQYRLVCDCFPDPGEGLPVRIWQLHA